MNRINLVYRSTTIHVEPESGSIIDVNDHARALALAAAAQLSSANATSNVADAAPTADTTPYAETFFKGLLTLKPRPVETQAGDVTKISYDYRGPIYNYIRNFRDENNQVVYKFVSDQERIVQTSLGKLKNSPSIPDDTYDPSIYGTHNLKLGLMGCLTNLMFLDYTMKQWMTEIFFQSEENYDTLDTEFL